MAVSATPKKTAFAMRACVLPATTHCAIMRTKKEEDDMAISELTPAEIETALADLPGWNHDAEGKALYRDIRLADFSEAFALMTRIAMAAEKADHHPEWSNVYNRLSIRLTTHEAGGITKRDVAMAEKISGFLGGA